MVINRIASHSWERLNEVEEEQFRFEETILEVVEYMEQEVNAGMRKLRWWFKWKVIWSAAELVMRG